MQVGAVDGHSPSDVHMTIPEHKPVATHFVELIVCPKLPQPGALSSIDAPGAQHTGYAAILQSATGSSQPQSFAPDPQAVAVASHVEAPWFAGGTQQWSIAGLQYRPGPPSTAPKGQ